MERSRERAGGRGGGRAGGSRSSGWGMSGGGLRQRSVASTKFKVASCTKPSASRNCWTEAKVGGAEGAKEGWSVQPLPPSNPRARPPSRPPWPPSRQVPEEGGREGGYTRPNASPPSTL